MKSLLAAIVISISALSSTTAFASDMRQQSASDDHHVIDGLGLLLDTPQTPVDEIYGPSTNLA